MNSVAKTSRSGKGRGALLVCAGLFGVAGAGLLGSYGLKVRGAQAAATPVTTETADAQPLVAPLRAATEDFLAGKLTVRFADVTLSKSFAELALVVDEESLLREGARLAKGGVVPSAISADYFQRPGRRVPVMLRRDLGAEALATIKSEHDRSATDARLDLEHRAVLPDRPGLGVDIYASMGAIEQAARAGEHEVTLVAREIPADVTQDKLGNIDIAQVMGFFETRYPVGEKDRNYNLKLAAEKLNGHVLMPGEEFSFNKVVGDRTEKEGFRVAHVIQAGEMIDGLAGGTCQISSTLHGASFFAGLEIQATRPHSRPSAYITMGMDATVVYPTVDLKMKNPYEFPVAIRYRVAEGVVRVEILGKGRPYDKIAFEREVKEEKPFETITREDDSMPIGSSLVEQPGFPGYKLERRRVFYKEGKRVRTERRQIEYPPTTEYLRIGTNPDPNLVAPVQPKVHGPIDPRGRTYTMAQ
jgi:vancomycin resistance protein YoaR